MGCRLKIVSSHMKKSIVGMLHPAPAVPFDYHTFGNVPFLRCVWPIAANTIHTEWVVVIPFESVLSQQGHNGNGCRIERKVMPRKMPNKGRRPRRQGKPETLELGKPHEIGCCFPVGEHVRCKSHLTKVEPTGQ